MGFIPDGMAAGKGHLASKIRAAGFLPLPLSSVRHHGQAAQALAGLLVVLRQDGRSTFRRLELIAKAAGLPRRTLQRHLAALEKSGLVVKSSSSERRTCTYRLTTSEADILADGFVPLPRFAAGLPWAQRLVYAWLLYRCELSHAGDTCEDSTRTVAAALGINQRSVLNAIAGLQKSGLVEREQLLAGDRGRFMLLPPPAQQGDEKVAHTTDGEVGSPANRVTKNWRRGDEKVAHLNTREGLTRMPDHRYTVEELRNQAGLLFKKSAYAGDDGRLLWQLAALHLAGRVNEFELVDACEACREIGPRNIPAYMRTVVAEHLAKRGQNLAAELRKVRLPPGTPAGPPPAHQRATVEPPGRTKGLVSITDAISSLGLTDGL